MRYIFVSMSDIEDHVDILSQDLENQYLSAGSSHRRDSESSGSSLVSSVAESKTRRSTRGRGSQTQGSGRTMRRVYPKVRTGCDTCKKRKIKCGEEKPVCENCIKSKRHCAGYHPPQANIFDPSALPPASSESSTERLCHYFRTETARRLASYRALQLSLHFWQTVVPRMADGCPPIHHAMLALAAMQENDEVQGSSQKSNHEEREQAWKQYGATLKKLRSGMESRSISDDEFLVCCLLLILCHLWNFELLNCFPHVIAGLRVCQHVKKTSPSRSPPSNSTDVCGEMLVSAFQHFADCGFVFMNDMDEPRFKLVEEFAQTLDILMPTTFAQADEAYATMDRLIRQIAKLDATAPTIQLTELSGYLASLRLTLQQTLALAYTGTDLSFVTELRMLLVHDRAASILLSGLTDDDEMVYDQHLIDFEFIISEIEDLLQLYGDADKPDICTNGIWLGVLPPLFLAATKCRDHPLRQRAIDLMHVAPHEEYMWTSCVAREVAMEVVRIEETHNFLLNTGSSPSDGSRVSLQTIYFNTLECKIELELEMQTTIGREIQRSAIHWEPKTEPEPVQPYRMPQRMVRACGYSTSMLSFRSTECHCGTGASPVNSNRVLQTTSN